MENCNRCNEPTIVTKPSWLNEDIICKSCEEIEKNHPLYQWGKHVEHLEVVKGTKTDNEQQKKLHFNYPGIFAGKSWKEIEETTPEILYALQRVHNHNMKEINKVEGKKEEAINLFGFTYNDKTIYNPFLNEDEKVAVHPLDYYPEKFLNELVDNYTNSFVALFEE